MIDITRDTGKKTINVNIDPDIAGVMAFRFPSNGFIIERCKDKKLGDFLKVRTVVGEVISLHFAAGIKVNGIEAEDNDMLMDLLDTHILD